MMMDIRFLITSIVLLVNAYSRAFAVHTEGGNASVKCREREKLSLLSLKHGFVDRYGNLSSWGNATNQNECCNWVGVHCDDMGYVDGLYLRYYNLEGTITSSLAELHNLKWLHLSYMNLKGNLPHELGNLLFLQELDLSGNQLEGGIPPPLGLCNLRRLDLSDNSLSGQLDDFVASFSPCDQTSFYFQVSSRIPFVKLVSLNISRNMLIGRIPATIGKLKSLNFLNLSRNHLSGNIPSEISQIDNLRVMDLSYNNLSGEIPHGTQLQSFDPSTYVGNTRLCGRPLLKCPSTEDNQNESTKFGRKMRSPWIFFVIMFLPSINYIICV